MYDFQNGALENQKVILCFFGESELSYANFQSVVMLGKLSCRGHAIKKLIQKNWFFLFFIFEKKTLLSSVSSISKITLIFVFFCIFGYAQLEQKAVPFIQNQLFSDYSTKKINQVQKDDKGTFYMSSHSGIIETDGLSYRNFSSGIFTDLQQIYVESDSVIYSCGYAGFGKWVRSSAGDLEYESIYFKEPTAEDYTQPIFLNVLPYGGQIVFHAHNQLFFYNPINKSYRTVQAPDFFNKLYVIDDSLYASSYNGKVFLFENDDFKLIASTGNDSGSVVYFGSFEGSEKILISQNGLIWNLRDKQLTLVKKISDVKINTAAVDDAGLLIIGTERKGVMLLDSQLQETALLTIEDGLTSNTISSIFIDDNNYWLVTDLGVDVLLNSMVSLLPEVSYIGTSYDYFLTKNKLLKATEKGLFELNLNQKNATYELVSGSEGVNWNIQEIDGTIFVGHERGIYVYQDGSFSLLHAILGVWNFRQHPKRDDLIFCGTYNGILILKKEDGEWGFYKRLDGFWDSSRFMEFDKSYLWVSHPSKGFFLLSLTENFEKVSSLKFYNNFKNNQKLYSSYFFKSRDELVFYNSDSFFKFDYSDSVFYPSKKYNKLFSNFNNIQSFSSNQDHILFISFNRLGLLTYDYPEPKINLSSFASNLVETNGDFTKLTSVNQDLFLVNTKKKTLFFDKNLLKSQNRADKNLPQPIFKKIINKGMSEVRSLELNPKTHPIIPYDVNTIEIDFFTPNRIYNPHHVIEWKLTSDSLWKKLPSTHKLTLTGLSTDKHTISVRSNDLQGNFSDTLLYSFKVLPAWYFSGTAIIVYILVILLAFYLVIYIKNINSEKQILNINKEKLKLEVENHNKELAFQAYLNIEKNDLLNRLKSHIFKTNKVGNKQKLPANIREIVNKIDLQFEDTNDWVKFEYHFQKANPDFFNKLQTQHPVLNANDLRLCAFIKSNLPNKKIASLLVITPKSLEMSRYRLRKKLDLSSGTDLFHYLSTL